MSDMRIAVVCSSNQNRSMEAHSCLRYKKIKCVVSLWKTSCFEMHSFNKSFNWPRLFLLFLFIEKNARETTLVWRVRNEDNITTYYGTIICKQ